MKLLISYTCIVGYNYLETYFFNSLDVAATFCLRMKDGHRNANEHNNVTYLEQRMQQTEVHNWVVVSASMILWTAANIYLLWLSSTTPLTLPLIKGFWRWSHCRKCFILPKVCVLPCTSVAKFVDTGKRSSLCMIYCSSYYQNRVIVE